MPDIRNTRTALQLLVSEADAPPNILNTWTALQVLCSEENAVPVYLRNTWQAVQVLANEPVDFRVTQVRLELLVSDAGFTHLAYVMRATDAAGTQYVYWEADDPSETATITYPVPVGPISDIRIFHEF